MADGTISFYLHHFVSSRIARVTYGLDVLRKYDDRNPEHTHRMERQFTDAHGEVLMFGAFATVLERVSMRLCKAV